MDHRSSINQLLATLGQTLGLDQLQLGPEDGCVLLFEGDLALTIEFDASTERLVLSIHVAKLPEGQNAELLQELLAANCFWLATGGATLGLQSNTASVLLTYASPVTELDDAQLEQLVENLLSMAQRWRERIEMFRPGLLPAAANAPDPATPTAPPIYG